MLDSRANLFGHDASSTKISWWYGPCLTQRVRVYVACTLDGFIAGPGDDLSWLPGADGGEAHDVAQDPAALSFDAFMADIGALLMGTRTYDVVEGIEGEWPYGEVPVLVPTHRPLSPASATARAVEGDIASLVALAKEAADGKDVYVDGDVLIRKALDANLIDDVVVTMVPVAIGSGHPLFAGVEQRQKFEVVGHHTFAPGLVQLHLHPDRSTS